jgi:predicted MFS family arabinose efflux permease
MHLWHTIAQKHYRIGFLSTAILSIGGFMMMPWGSAFAINNLHITQQQLPIIFMVSGVSSLFTMPLIGKLSDTVDKFKIFSIASVVMIIMVLIYTNLTPVPFALIILFNIFFMVSMMSRMVPAMALTTGLPKMHDRGAFMSINASLQQIAGGVAAAVGGMIVMQKDKYSPLEHYNTLGIVIALLSVISIFMVYRVSNMVKQRKAMGL